MNSEQYSELVSDLIDTRLTVSDSTQCASLLSRLNGLRSWVEAQSIAVTQRLDQLATETPGIFPEQIVADATRVSLTQAIQPFQRAKAVELLPEFGDGTRVGRRQRRPPRCPRAERCRARPGDPAATGRS